MDEKTEALRDIFVEVTDEETVTERQQETPGSLTTDESVDERLLEVLARMRADLEFRTSLSDDDLLTVVRGFYAADDDAAIADAVDDPGVDAVAVTRARFDLHLLRDADTDGPFDAAEFRRAIDGGATDADLAERFDVDRDAAARYRAAFDACEAIRRVNDRYRNEFENVLRDRELSERLTDDEDGLEDATEGQEVDVSF